MIVRDDDGNILNINSLSTTQLYHHHVNAAERVRLAKVGDLIFLTSEVASKIFNY